MTPEEVRTLLSLAVQVPLVAAFILFAIMQNRAFLQHISEIDKRRTEAAEIREKERREADRQRDAEWRIYLAESRNSYLLAINNITIATTESSKAETVALGVLTKSIQELTESMIRHDAATGVQLGQLSKAAQH